MMTCNMIYITAPNRNAALKMARELVENRLVACANVLDGATSFYWWEGKVQEDREAVLIAKTTSEKTSTVINKIMEVHEYVCPCIVALPIAEGNPAFLEWIRSETSVAV
jgi:periplasmic divalent cation tolerance protein